MVPWGDVPLLLSEASVRDSGKTHKDTTQEINVFTEREPGQPTFQRQWIGCGAGREPIALV